MLAGSMIAPHALSAQQPPVQGVPAPLPTCRQDPDVERCMVAIERHLVSQTAGRVLRRDTVLEVRTGSDTLVFVDHNSGTAYVRHFFAGQLPGGKYAIVERHLYEGHEYLLIDWQSADSTHLPAPPVLSPEGERFAAASRDEEGWYADNLLQVWHFTDDGPVMEFQVKGGFGCEPAAVRWVSSSSVEFVWVDENRGREIPAKLVRESTGSWRMDPPPEEYGSYYECRQ